MTETNFKHTEIGLIPHDWEVKTISEVADNYTGLTYSPLDVCTFGGTLVLRSSNIQEDVLSFKDNVFVNMEIPERAKTKENDILVCVRNGSNRLIGKSAMIPKEYENVAFGAFMTVLRTVKIDSGYLLHIWRSEPTQQQVHETFGATINQITDKDFKRILIPLPPTLEEQERIAGALSSIDTLIGALNEQIEKKRHIKQGTMQQLLTGKKRLEGFTGAWKEVRLGDVAKLKSGYAFKSTTYSNIGKFKIITITNVQNGVLDMSDYNKIAEIPSNIQEHQILKEGDILISMTGNVGRVCRVDCKNCLLNQRVGVFALKNTIDTEYLYVILNNLEFEKEMIGKGHGAAQPNIGSSDVESYCFVVPPTIAEQSAIATVLSRMDTEIAALEQKRDKYIAIKNGMMQDLLTGKIRLV